MYKGSEWRGAFGEKKQKAENNNGVNIAVAKTGTNPKPETDPPSPPGSAGVHVRIVRGNRNRIVHGARCCKTNGWVVHQQSGKIKNSQLKKFKRKTR